MTPLSMGQIRGLSATSTDEGVFTILAFDHRQSFVRMLSQAAPDSTDYDSVAQRKSTIVRALGQHASAVLLDPIYGVGGVIAQRALPGSTGLLVALEESGYDGPTTARQTRLLDHWSVEKIKHLGANAVKLLVYYHPEAGQLTTRQEELIQRVIAACNRSDIPLFLEAVSYSIDPGVDKRSAAFAALRPMLLVKIAKRLSALGPQVLKLEFPVDVEHDQDKKSWAAACASVSEAATCPWALLSAGVDFEVFVEQVRVACQQGASGYIAGRAIWKEVVPLASGEREEWLRSTAAERLKTLTHVARRNARPWMDFWPELDAAAYEGWYADYRAAEKPASRRL